MSQYLPTGSWRNNLNVGLTSSVFGVESLSFREELQDKCVEFREAILEVCGRLIAPFKIEPLHNFIVCQSQCDLFNAFGNK